MMEGHDGAIARSSAKARPFRPIVRENLMSEISVQCFKDAVRDHPRRLADIAAGGRKILGYFCTYTPVELIHAAGFMPVRVMGGPLAISRADSLVPNFICPYMRQTLEKALRGDYEFLSGMVQGYTCDVACGLMKIWEENIPGEIFHSIPLPYNSNPEAKAYFRASVRELTDRLSEIGGHFNEGALSRSLQLYGEIRQEVLDLYAMRNEGLAPWSAGDFLSIVRAGFVTDPDDYLAMLKELTRQAAQSSERPRDGFPVLVSGSLVEDPSVLDLLEACGGRVVADDLCTGLRNFYPATGEGENPTDRLLDRYMNRFPCPSRSRAEQRISLIVDLVERSGAGGVVFLLQKFCTPHLADHPVVSEGLKRAGVPNILIEMEETSLNQGQIRTRLQAFFEMSA
jgi:benzoyl-CoA reductase/2-hydroxyglutaryl-CoA dehydratase subunit BcrC/BadD/HgdB